MTAINVDKNASPIMDGLRRDYNGSYSIGLSGTAVVKSSAGVLKKIFVNSTSSGKLIVYDSTSTADQVLVSVFTPAANGMYDFNALFNNDLTIGTLGTTITITVIYA